MEDEKEKTGETRQGCAFGFIPPIGTLFSESTRSHFRNSRIEFWKGIRGIIDDRIERMERAGQKGTHVTVE